MLALDSQRWSTLQHAYGAADDIPDLLKQLDQLPHLPDSWRKEPLGRLWESLCHQGVPDEAAYAAVPHLVRIVAEKPLEERASVLHLVGSIAAASDVGAPVPDDLAEALGTGLRLAASLVLESVTARNATGRELLLLFGDLAACTGHRALGRSIIGMESEEFDVVCGHCSARYTLGFQSDEPDEGIAIEPMKWLERPEPPPARNWTVGALMKTAGDDPNAFASVARTLGENGLARGLMDLSGTIACPECGSSVRIMTGIARS